MGLVTLYLAGAQVIGGLIRPHNPAPGEDKSALRMIFEVMHKCGGYAALACAVVAILSGVDHSYEFSYISNKTPFLVEALLPLAGFAVALVGGKVYTLIISPTTGGGVPVRKSMAPGQSLQPGYDDVNSFTVKQSMTGRQQAF